ncbi:MAG: hypothetical protein EXS05_07685 [Planctomycetaceae bacterium]|nr:hypothetical protein [Planctomycetaceae bacterium]
MPDKIHRDSRLARGSLRCGVVAAALLAVAFQAMAAEPVQLTHDGRFKFCPVYCAQGREIVYVELATPMLYRLTRLKLDDGSTEPLHPEAQTSEFDPAFSADGKVYAFLKTVGTLRVNLEIMEPGGTKLGEVPPGDGFSGMRSPAVAPDRQHVVYSFAAAGRQQLYEVRADGKEKRALTDSRGINNWPAYSPAGRELVFGSSRDGDFEIYRMPAAGGEATRLTESPGQDIRPKFSPDGRQIAFTSHRDGNAEIYVMNADGTQLRRLTASPDRDDYCDWHPDGRQLLIVSDRNGRYDLFLVSIEP